MMHDPSMKIESLAQQLAMNLVEPWDAIDEDRKKHYRGTAFAIYMNTVAESRDAMLAICMELEVMLSDENTPNRWIPGLQKALKRSFDVIQDRDERLEIGVEVPEVLPDDFDSEDPYSNVVAGQMDPVEWQEVQCEHIHAKGWVCTRAPHPPHWKHWDADRDLPEPFVPGMICVTWFNDDYDFESVAPILATDED